MDRGIPALSHNIIKKCHLGSAVKTHVAEFSNRIIQSRMKENSNAVGYTVQGTFRDQTEQIHNTVLPLLTM